MIPGAPVIAAVIFGAFLLVTVAGALLAGGMIKLVRT